MGLIFLTVVCIVMLVLSVFLMDKFQLKGFSFIFLITTIIFGVLGISFLICLFPDEKECYTLNYDKEELVEVINLKELENNVYVTYNYSTKEYYYKEINSINTINPTNKFIEEICDPDKEIMIARYKLSKPNDFYYKNLPWVTATKYVIHVKDKNMIKRINE